MFDTLTTTAIKLGDDTYSTEAPVRAVNINGNIIKSTPVNETTYSYAMEIGRNATYASIHQTQFENRLFANWEANTYPRPYYMSTQNSNAYNFIDTLDPNTDEQQVLRFKFSQPTWVYLDYLVNQQGKKVLVVDKTDEDVTAPNGLNIVESNNGLDIRAVGTPINGVGDVSISIGNSKDLILGSGTKSEEEVEVSGNIQIKKTLQLNDNSISNELGDDDIKIKTAKNGVILVDNNSESERPYEELLSNSILKTEEREIELQNALVNVAYVKRQIIDTYEKIITYKDLENLDENGELPLITFNPDIYGDNIHLKRITLNVRVPFYKTYEYINKATPYIEGYIYYAGDVVTIDGTDTYAVVVNTHISPENDIHSSNRDLQIISNEPYDSIKYINVIGKNDNILTKTYSEDYYDITDYVSDYVNIQKNNRFGYINCTEFTNGYTPSKEEKLVQYCDRNYIIFAPEEEQSEEQTEEQTEEQIENGYTSADLHNDNKASRKYDEGYCYVFEMDRNVHYIMGDRNPVTENYSGETLKLAFYNKDKKKFLPNANMSTDESTDESVEDYVPYYESSQLNPGGKLLVRIEFLREEVEEITNTEESS